MKMWIVVLTISFFTFLFQNCSKVDFSPLKATDTNHALTPGLSDPDDPKPPTDDNNDDSTGDESGDGDGDGDDQADLPNNQENEGDNILGWAQCVESESELEDAQPLNPGVILENIRGTTRFLASHILSYSHNAGTSTLVGHGQNPLIDILEDVRGTLTICGMNITRLVDVAGTVRVVNANIGKVENVRGTIIIGGNVSELKDIRGTLYIHGDVDSINGIDSARGTVHVYGNVNGNINSMHGTLIVDGSILGSVTNSRGTIRTN